MRRQYLYLMTLICGTLSYTMGAEHPDKPKTTGRGALSSSKGIVEVGNDPLRGKVMTSSPPTASAPAPILSAQLPPYRSSAPKLVPQPTNPSPTERVLQVRTNHPSEDSSSATPKYPPDATHKPLSKNLLAASSADDEEPTNS